MNLQKKGEKPNIKKRASRMIEGASRLGEYRNGGASTVRVTTVGHQPTKFQRWPAYLVSIHMNYSKSPQVIDSDDSKIMIFSDGKDTYLIALDIANAPKIPSSRSWANQVWKNVLKEIRPIGTA